MVFLHGGSLSLGHSGPYGPEFLMERDIVLVTINYRLGPMGFLNLGPSAENNADGFIPSGNQGLWDQIQALKGN